MNGTNSFGHFVSWDGGCLLIGKGAVVPVHAHYAIQLAFGSEPGIRFRASERDEWSEFGGAIIASRQPHTMDVTRVWHNAVIFVEPETRDGRALAGYGNDPRAAELGRALFFDTRLSGNGKVSCASCHVPAQEFQDGKPLASGVGTTARRTMPVAGTAHSPWQFWDGRADSQWAQALGPLESAAEHGGSRTQYAHLVAEHHRREYEAVFGTLPDLAGLPRSAGPVVDTFTPDEEAGLRLFIGKANCVNCHNGALLTDNHFHNTGVPQPATSALPADSGRTVGVRQAVRGEFSCTSRYSDAGPDDCEELEFAVTEGAELVRAYKTPSLRNVAERAPYMHAGQIATLAEVIAHYSAAPAAPFGHSELKPLHLSADERRQIEAFLRTLSGPLVAPAGYLEAPAQQR